MSFNQKAVEAVACAQCGHEIGDLLGEGGSIYGVIIFCDEECVEQWFAEDGSDEEAVVETVNNPRA